jgi:hypothetical protein
MRGLIKFLGIICVLAAIYFIRDAWDARQIEKDTSELASTVINTVGVAWKEADFKKFQDPFENHYLVNNVERNMAKSLAIYVYLGKITTTTDCKMGEFTAYKADKEDYISVNYACRAGFEKDVVAINIVLRRFKAVGEWKMSYFDVRSAYLAGIVKKMEPDKPKPKEDSTWDKLRNTLPSTPTPTMPTLPELPTLPEMPSLPRLPRIPSF